MYVCDNTTEEYKRRMCYTQNNNSWLQSLKFAKQFQILQKYNSKNQMTKISKGQKILKNHKI